MQHIDNCPKKYLLDLGSVRTKKHFCPTPYFQMKPSVGRHWDTGMRIPTITKIYESNAGKSVQVTSCHCEHGGECTRILNEHQQNLKAAQEKITERARVVVLEQ